MGKLVYKKNYLTAACLFVAMVSLFVFVASSSSVGMETGEQNRISNVMSETFASGPTGNFVLAITGDVMLGRYINIELQKGMLADPFEGVREYLENADLTYVNLESPFFDPCPLTSTGMIFCSDREGARLLKESGIDVVNLANNHIRNYGLEGYEFTKKVLFENSIAVSDSENLAAVYVDSTKIGFVGFDLVSRSWNDDDIKDIIIRARDNTDILVAGFHWGFEYQDEPSDYQRRIGKLAVDSGADLVVGSHPHVLQSIEEYRNVPIFYSLGNFVFDQFWSEETREGVIGIVNFRNSGVSSYHIIPVYVADNGFPQIISDTDYASELLTKLKEQN